MNKPKTNKPPSQTPNIPLDPHLSEQVMVFKGRLEVAIQALEDIESLTRSYESMDHKAEVNRTAKLALDQIWGE